LKKAITRIPLNAAEEIKVIKAQGGTGAEELEVKRKNFGMSQTFTRHNSRDRKASN